MTQTSTSLFIAHHPNGLRFYHRIPKMHHPSSTTTGDMKFPTVNSSIPCLTCNNDNNNRYSNENEDMILQRATEMFPYVDASIGRILLLVPVHDNNKRHVPRFALKYDDGTQMVQLQEYENTIGNGRIESTNDLIQLALDCDIFMLHHKNCFSFDPTLQALINLANETSAIQSTDPIIHSIKDSDQLLNEINNYPCKDIMETSNEYITIATILATSILESTIRKTIKSSNRCSNDSGGAPLL